MQMQISHNLHDGSHQLFSKYTVGKPLWLPLLGDVLALPQG
jgi:hypothetical protein